MSRRGARNSSRRGRGSALASALPTNVDGASSCIPGSNTAQPSYQLRPELSTDHGQQSQITSNRHQTSVHQSSLVSQLSSSNANRSVVSVQDGNGRHSNLFHPLPNYGDLADRDPIIASRSDALIAESFRSYEAGSTLFDRLHIQTQTPTSPNLPSLGSSNIGREYAGVIVPADHQTSTHRFTRDHSQQWQTCNTRGHSLSMARGSRDDQEYYPSTSFSWHHFNHSYAAAPDTQIPPFDASNGLSSNDIPTFRQARDSLEETPPIPDVTSESHLFFASRPPSDDLPEAADTPTITASELPSTSACTPIGVEDTPEADITPRRQRKRNTKKKGSYPTDDHARQLEQNYRDCMKMLMGELKNTLMNTGVPEEELNTRPKVLRHAILAVQRQVDQQGAAPTASV